MIAEEELLAEEVLEEAEPTPGAEEVPETGVTTETEAESGAAIGGPDGLKITGIEELTPEEADQLPKIELPDEEGEENAGEIESKAELEGFPGDELLLPGWGYSINSEYDLVLFPYLYHKLINNFSVFSLCYQLVPQRGQ